MFTRVCICRAWLLVLRMTHADVDLYGTYVDHMHILKSELTRQVNACGQAWRSTGSGAIVDHLLVPNIIHFLLLVSSLFAYI